MIGIIRVIPRCVCSFRDILDFGSKRCHTVKVLYGWDALDSIDRGGMSMRMWDIPALRPMIDVSLSTNLQRYLICIKREYYELLD